MKTKQKRIIKISILLVTILVSSLSFINSVYATNINSAHLYSVGDCGKLLTYKGIAVKVSYVQYINDGVSYPAYCLDKTKPGAETQEYSVSVDQAITDVGLWKRVINGYPYKTIEELGVANANEAFTATKQAIYCYIHGNNPADYGAIGEAGTRTLNAMYKIIANAENSSEYKISSTIKINETTSNWEQDTKENTYVSKTYNVVAGAEIQNYTIELYRENGQDLGGIKLTDENNVEKKEFAPDEKFKILIPIKNLTEDGEFNLKVEAKIKTKPVLYGIAPSSSYQDYALTTATYEDGTGTLKAKYNKNETKIIVIKQDEETNARLEGVEFELLDENRNASYTDLKTNKEGKVTIENLVPGRYYLKEVNTIDGYKIYDEMVVIDIDLNEQVNVTVNNRKEEKPAIEKTENYLSVSNKNVKKLPVTGM